MCTVLLPLGVNKIAVNKYIVLVHRHVFGRLFDSHQEEDTSDGETSPIAHFSVMYLYPLGDERPKHVVENV